MGSTERSGAGRPAVTPGLRDGEPAYRAPSRRRRITTDHGMTRPTILVGRPTVLRTEQPSRMSRPVNDPARSGLQIDGAAPLGADRGEDLVEGTRWDGLVDGHHDQGVPTLGVAADLHAGDVDPGIAEHSTDDSDDARPVLVAQEGHVVARLHLDVVAQYLDQLLDVAGAGEGAPHPHRAAVGQ